MRESRARRTEHKKLSHRRLVGPCEVDAARGRRADDVRARPVRAQRPARARGAVDRARHRVPGEPGALRGGDPSGRREARAGDAAHAPALRRWKARGGSRAVGGGGAQGRDTGEGPASRSQRRQCRRGCTNGLQGGRRTRPPAGIWLRPDPPGPARRSPLRPDRGAGDRGLDARAGGASRGGRGRARGTDRTAPAHGRERVALFLPGSAGRVPSARGRHGDARAGIGAHGGRGRAKR